MSNLGLEIKKALNTANSLGAAKSSNFAKELKKASRELAVKKINISTLTSDVSGALSATGDVIGTWHDASSINATKDQVNSILKRLNLAETYFSGDEFKDNRDAQGMLEYVRNAKKTLSGDITSSLDSAIEYYGKFANADEYNSDLAYNEAKKQRLEPFANLTSKDLSSFAKVLESNYEQANKRPSFWGSVTEASKGSHAALDPFRALDQGEAVLRQDQIAAFNEKYKDYGITYESYNPELIKELEELSLSRALEEYTKEAAGKINAESINREEVIERLKEFSRKYNGGVARSYDNLTNEQLAAYKYYSDLSMPSVELPAGKAEKINKEAIKTTVEDAQKAQNTADWFASTLIRYNNEQNKEKFLEDARKLGSENGFLGMYGAEWLGGAASLIGNVGTAIESGVSYILDGKIKKDGNFSGIANVGDALREGATSYKTSWIKNENARKFTEYLSNIGYSIADNVAVMAVSYAIGNAAGGTAQAVSNISLAIMGTSAAGATIRESLAKGASDEEALALGAISGALEIVTEKIPLENLIKLGEEGAKQAVIKELLKQAGTEAAEESISEIGNIIADVVVLAEKSDYAKRLEELKASGEKNPDLKLFGELAHQVVQSAGAGAISGAVLGTGALGLNKVRNTNAFIEAGRYYDAQKSAEAIVNAGLTYGEDTEIHELAKSIKINSDGHTSNHRALGKLYYLMTDGVKDSLVAELRSSIADKVKNKSAQNGLIKILSGETPTKLEKRALAKDSAAQEVLRNSSAARDISEEWFPIVKNTVYALKDGSLLIERDKDGYTVTFTPKGAEGVKTAEKQSIEKVSRIINEFREGKMPEFNTVDVGAALDSFEETVKAYEDRQNKKTPDESKKYHVPEYVKSVARYLITAHDGDLRIEFSNKRSDGKTGIWRKNADGTRTVTIAANAKGINGVLIHELLHDLNGTVSGKKLIAELAEKAKTVLPGEEKSQYDKIKDLYAEKGINEDIDEEVAAAYLQAEFGKGDRMLHLVQSLGANSAKEMKRALESYSRATEKAVKDGELSGADAAPLRAAALAVARHARLYNEALAQSATMAAVQRNTRSDRTAAENKKSAPDNTETEKTEGKAEVKEKFALLENVTDEIGKKYKKVVKLEYKTFNIVKRSGKAYVNFIRNNLIKQKIAVYDSNGNEEIIEFAGEKEIVKKDGAKNSHPVIGELTQVRNPLKKLVVLNLVETAQISEFANQNNENVHQWLDKNGWEERTSYVMTEDGTIYPVTLHIAKAKDGRNILYDANIKIKEGVAIDKSTLSSTAKKQLKPVVKVTTPDNKIISQKSDLSTDFEKKSQENAEKAVFGTKTAEKVTPEADTYSEKYCLTEAADIGKSSIAYNDRHDKVNAAVMKVGVETMIEMAHTMLPYLDEEGILPPDTKGKTIFKNGSYGRSGENTTLCVRTLTYEDFKDRVASELGRPLTVAESLLVSQKIYDIATDPQCIYCYVAADRKAYDEYLGEYHKSMRKYITALRNGGDSKALYQKYLDGRKDTSAQQKRWATWSKIAKSGAEYISASDLATKARRDAVIKKGGALADQVKDAQRYAQSASWAKKIFDYRAYNGEILRLSEQLVKTLNDEYGLRMYSFSDYTPAFIVENMQMIIDAACRGLKSLAYSKDTDYVKIFARTGQAINVSCFAMWDPATKSFIEDSRQGASWSETKQLRKKHKNVGSVMVATTPRMVEWALRQDWIDIVIPYHIVKTGTTIANEYQWRNFTADSSDKQGSRVANIYPTEHNNDFDTYNKLVKERGLTPRFNEYYERALSGDITKEQYMKLVNEVRLPASELLPVVPDFDLDAARESFGVDENGKIIEGGFVDKGGYMGSWYKDGVDVEQEVLQVAGDIRSGKSSLDVEYGVSYSVKQKQAEKYGVKEKLSLTDDKSSSDIVKAVLFSDRDVELSKAKAHLTQDRVFNKAEFLNTIRESTAERLSELIGIQVRKVSYDYEMLDNVARGLAVQINKGADDALIRELTRKASELITDSVLSVQDQSIVNEKGADKVEAAYKAYNKIKSYRGKIDMSPEFKSSLATAYGEKTADFLINRWSKKEGAGKTLATALEELSEKGVNVKIGENDAETLYNLNSEMKKLADLAFSANKKLVETNFGAAERTKLIDSLAEDLYSVAKEGGEPGKLALRYSALKAHSEVIKIKEILNRHRETGKLGSPEYNAVLKAARTLSRGISKNGMKAENVNELLKKFTNFLEIHAPKLTDLVKKELDNLEGIEAAAKEYNDAKNGEDTENSDLYKHVPYDLAKKLFLLKEMVADPNAALEPQHYEALAELLKTMRRLDSFYAKVYRDGHWIEAAPIAEKTARNLTVRIKALGNKGKGKKGETILPSDVTNLDTGEKAISKKLDAQKFIYNSLSPEVVAAMVAGFDEDSEIYKLIREIQDAAVEAQYLENEFKRSFEKFFKENKGYEERYQTHRIKYTFERAMPTGGVRKYHVTMTLGEAMYMYALAKRPHAETSLAIAQFDFIPRDGYITDKRTHIPAVYFSGDYTSEEYEEQIRKMADFFKRSINKMAEENFNALDREFIKVFEEFFNKTSSEAKSNADLERYGYTNVGESYYIPMVRSANGRDVNLLGLDYTLDAFSGVRNFSFNKRTVERARAPVAVQEVWELVQSHAHNLANYVALNDPLENLQRIYNAKISVGEGEYSELTSLRAVIEKQSWDGFTDYLRTYIKDVQGNTETPAQDKLLMKFLRKIKSNYAVSVLALNIASYAKQGSSVFAMANQVSREAWWHGLQPKPMIKNEDKIDVYSHGAAIRHNAVDKYRASSGMDKITKRGEKLMFLLEKGDRSAIKRMWNMCQYEVYKNTGHMIGSEENLVAAGKMLDDMIIRVQDTSSASTKSAHARSKQELMSLTTMFRSADIKLTSNIYYSFAKVNALRRMSKSDPSLVSASDVKEQIKIAAQYGAVWLLTQTYQIAIDIMRSRIRGNKKERPIGEGEMNVFDEYFFNLLTGMVGQIPVVGGALEELLEGYDSTNLYAQTLSSVADIISGSKSLIESAADGELTSGQIMKQLRNTAFTFGQLTGLPVRNVYNIIRSSIHMFPSATYSFDNFFGLNASTYSADLKSAIEGDNERLASTVISAISKDRTGEGVGKDTAEELVSLYSKGHTNILPSSFGKSVSITVNGESQDVDLSAKQRKALESEYGKSTNAVSKLVSSSAYKKLTSDERAAAVKSLYSIYRQRALSKVLGSDRAKQDLLSSMMDETKLVCALSHIKTLKNDKKGNVRSRVNAYLRTLGLTSEERNIVLYSAGYRDEDINASVTRSLRRLSLKSKELSAAKELLGL